ncbi:uncharacterized protein LOC124270114 [Haliotis rubra]|uniref:uncharacterized protein LOC124270114 n=1 Tax=Haliotis rubra TaxID=36100 RepID=UPI001EE579B1|nr:uncharacterized protein LOC124270114 [Haliotis rubra]
MFRPIASTAEAASADVTNCCTQIKSWMNINKLKLNDDKTECMLIGPSARCTQSGLTAVQIGSSSIDVTRSVKNLGVFLDSELSMKQLVSHISRVCSFQLRNVSNIRRYLTKESLIILILTLVTSRLDYCNSLLAGAPRSDTNKLQHIQNTAARIVSSCRKYDHITPILHDLHWLPIRQRISYKILCHVYRCLSEDAPQYLCDLITEYKPARSLRSENKLLLQVPSVKSVNYGQRSFALH